MVLSRFRFSYLLIQHLKLWGLVFLLTAAGTFDEHGGWREEVIKAGLLSAWAAMAPECQLGRFLKVEPGQPKLQFSGIESIE